MIRKIKRKVKENWIKLYCGYARFYKVPMKQEILDTLWSWIHDEIHVVNGICYEIEDKIVGIAHYRTMPRPIKGQYIGFLDDLFVDEHFRGQKIAQKLIKYLKSISKENKWDGIRWITHSSNETAKKLYDKIAKKQDLNYMNLKGTKFQIKVWNYLKKIPKGEVRTYLQVAKAIGRPKAHRAVANAVGKNPYPPKIPCHRVIRTDGSLGGYSGKGGIKTKLRLLRSEKVDI